jgi:enamine deaminase RidA (YjgF/YER057c/UK114 family)
VNPPDVWDSTQYGFSQAVVADARRLIFVSGQVDFDRDEAVRHPDDLGAQARGSLENLQLVLEAAGATIEDVLSMRIYIVGDPRDDLSPVSDALRDASCASSGRRRTSTRSARAGRGDRRPCRVTAGCTARGHRPRRSAPANRSRRLH